VSFRGGKSPEESLIAGFKEKKEKKEGILRYRSDAVLSEAKE